MLHRDGERGYRQMKKLTISLLTLIQEKCRLSPAELEEKFGIGLRSLDDIRTGQEWRRYIHVPDGSKKNNQALSLKRFLIIAIRAVEIEILKPEELYPFNILDIEDPKILYDRVSNQGKAFSLFKKGIDRLHSGKMPLSPARELGGRTRKPNSAEESSANYFDWLERMEDLGAWVREDRTELMDYERSLISGFNADIEKRVLTPEEYAFMNEWDRPFDILSPFPEAISRLVLYFEGSDCTGVPWKPKLIYEGLHLKKYGRKICTNVLIEFETLISLIEKSPVTKEKFSITIHPWPIIRSRVKKELEKLSKNN